MLLGVRSRTTCPLRNVTDVHGGSPPNLKIRQSDHDAIRSDPMGKRDQLGREGRLHRTGGGLCIHAMDEIEVGT